MDWGSIPHGSTKFQPAPLLIGAQNMEVELVCGYCKEKFLKDKREYDRQTRKGRSVFYCDKSCQASGNNKRYPRPKLENLRRGSQPDEFSPFRWFMLRARYRREHGETDIDVSYLKELWHTQNGICPFTDWELILPKDVSGWTKPSHKNASLDRIENDKGYVRGNVRFIALIANLARGQFSDSDLVDFCNAVVNQRLHQTA
jgi:hypothetical protein